VLARLGGQQSTRSSRSLSGAAKAHKRVGRDAEEKPCPTFPGHHCLITHFGHLRSRTQGNRSAKAGNAMACGFCGSTMMTR
jgi:hypothetical protein